MNKRTYLAQYSQPYGDNCFSCGGFNNPYMLKNSLWKELVPEAKVMSSKWHRDASGELVREGGCFICLSCIEKRLGRGLKESDFLESKPPINYGVFGFDCSIYCKLKE